VNTTCRLPQHASRFVLNKISNWWEPTVCLLRGLVELTLQPELYGIAKTNHSITSGLIVFDDEHFFVSLRVFWKSENGRYNAQAFVTNLRQSFIVRRRSDTVGNI
jgi:hypothetical protein